MFDKSYNQVIQNTNLIRRLNMTGGDYVVVKAEATERVGKILAPRESGVVVFRGSRSKCRQFWKKEGGTETGHFICLSVSRRVGDKVPFLKKS